MHKKIPKRPCDAWGFIAQEGLRALLWSKTDWIDKISVAISYLAQRTAHKDASVAALRK
tara:strand:- start:49 stop:225 length:177 start_codon:yes stop_codon:yes gene_type:complete